MTENHCCRKPRCRGVLTLLMPVATCLVLAAGWPAIADDSPVGTQSPEWSVTGAAVPGPALPGSSRGWNPATTTVYPLTPPLETGGVVEVYSPETQTTVVADPRAPSAKAPSARKPLPNSSASGRQVVESAKGPVVTIVKTAAVDDDGQPIVPVVTQLPPPVPPAPEQSSSLPAATSPAQPPLMLSETGEPLFFEPVDPPFVAYEEQLAPAGHDKDCNCLDCDKPWGPLKKFDFYSQLLSGDVGIGEERVAFAPFQIEQAQPYRNNRLRFDSAFGLTSPDRAEYFWAAAGTGPAIPASEIDYFDFHYTTEAANGNISLITDIPLRALDYNDTRTGGLGNISFATKTAIVTGSNWYVSSIMRMYLPLGSKSRGTSNGHIAIEPGLLARYRITDRAYFHGQAKWWIPFGGDSSFNGQVLNYGGGFSWIAYESDAFAVLPTLEFDAWTVASGQKTLPGGTVTSVGGDTFVNVMPGLRYVFGPAGDLGLFEFGIMGGFSFGDPGWYDQILRTELRWSF